MIGITKAGTHDTKWANHLFNSFLSPWSSLRHYAQPCRLLHLTSLCRVKCSSLLHHTSLCRAKCSMLPSESPLAKAEQGQRSKTFTSWNQNDLFAHDLVGAFDFRKGKQKKPEAKCLLRSGFHWKNKRVKSASATGRSHSRHRHTLSPMLLFPSCLQNTHPYSAYKTQNRYRGL